MKRFLAGSSKKMIVTFVAFAIVLMKDWLELSPEQLEAVYVLGGGYLVGQGLSDFSKGAKEKELQAKNNAS